MYFVPTAGQRGLEYLRNDATGLEEDWKYRGVPIFVNKVKERIVYRIWYGSEVYEHKFLRDAMATIDTLLQILAWKLKIHPNEILVCPVCEDYVGPRETTFGHYLKRHVKQPHKTVQTLAEFEYNWCETYYINGQDLGGTYIDLSSNDDYTFQPLDLRTVREILFG